MDGDSKYTDYNEINSKGFFTYVQCRKGEECVVLKGLKEEYQKKIYQEALKKEFAIGQKLNHAGIIKYLDLVETDKYGICIELEYVEGRSLKAYYKEQHSDDEKRMIVDQISGALQYIHSQGIVHGGLNPESIWISKNGNRVKILNFRTIYTYDHDTFETIKYIAPEQKDSTVAWDSRADIFSLGVILKDLGFFPEYENIIKRCISLGKKDRYADASEFLEDFNDDSSPITIDKRWIVTGVVAVVLAAIVFFVVQGGYLSNISFPSTNEQADSVSKDTVNSSQIVPKEEQTPKDTATQTKPEVPANDGDALKTEMTQGLDSVYQPYQSNVDMGQKLSKSEWNGLHNQTKGYYRHFVAAHADLTQEQRQTLDENFGSYVKEKNRALIKQ